MAAVRPARPDHPHLVHPRALAAGPDPAQRAGGPDAGRRELHPVRRGTSSNGLSVHRLKTSLLSVAEPWVLDCPIAVQAVTLAYVRLADGTPIDTTNCDLYAWHGDADLLPHLWNVLQMDGRRGASRAAEPMLSWSVTSRKRARGRAARPARPATGTGFTPQRQRAPPASRSRRRRVERRPKRKKEAEPPFQIGPACVGFRLVMARILTVESRSPRPNRRKSQLSFNHHFLDLGDGLGWIEALRAGVGAVHDRVAAVELERVLQRVQPVAGGLVAAVDQPAIGLQQGRRPQDTCRRSTNRTGTTVVQQAHRMHS